MRSYAAHVVAATLLIAVFPLAAQTTANSNGQMHRERPKPTNLQVLPKDISAKD